MLENKNKKFKCSDKTKIYLKLCFNFLLNFLILLILLCGIYDISILNIIQSTYLILAIIDWICITTYNLIKIVLMPLGKLPPIKYCFKLWIIFYIPSFILMFIGVVYDIFKVFLTSGISGVIMYYLLFVFACILFVCFAINDHKNIEKQYQLSKEKVNPSQLREEEMQDVSNFKKE